MIGIESRDQLLDMVGKLRKNHAGFDVLSRDTREDGKNRTATFESVGRLV